jgi:hypothetical protein
MPGTPEYIVRVVSDVLEIPMSAWEIKRKANSGLLAIEAKEAGKAIEGSSLPNERRTQMKVGVESEVRSHRLSARALDVYTQLISHSFDMYEG